MGYWRSRWRQKEIYEKTVRAANGVAPLMTSFTGAVVLNALLLLWALATRRFEFAFGALCGAIVIVALLLASGIGR